MTARMARRRWHHESASQLPGRAMRTVRLYETSICRYCHRRCMMHDSIFHSRDGATNDEQR